MMVERRKNRSSSIRGGCENKPGSIRLTLSLGAERIRLDGPEIRSKGGVVNMVTVVKTV